MRIEVTVRNKRRETLRFQWYQKAMCERLKKGEKRWLK